jgi:hypothetical protein
VNEAARASETSVNFCQTTRRNKPEDIHLYTRRRENLKSLLIVANLAKKSSALIMEPKYSLLGLQEPANGFYVEASESSPHPDTLFP